jgi:Zn-dependent protease with chaperone function
MLSLRRLTVFLCLVAVLLAALSPSASGNAVCLVTVFFYFIATVVTLAFCRRNETEFLPSSPLIAVLASRAPPCG